MSNEASTELLPLGVAAAIAANKNPDFVCKPQAFNEFSMADRVALITGGNSGMGLEMAQVLLEAGARVVYTVDLPLEPSEAWTCVKDYIKKMGLGGRLEYVRGDVTDQKAMWAIGDLIGEKEGRLDVTIANAGIAGVGHDVAEYPAEDYSKVIDVNLKGVLYTAQAGVRQMEKFKMPGSIILNLNVIGYQTAKAGVIQMARDLACMLAPQGIRCNALSPGWVMTEMVKPYLTISEDVQKVWSAQSPMNRMAKPHEIRGAVLWLASDASSFCTGSDIVVSGGWHAWAG
ncbi:NAD-P-binding protein [Vararia minispora EC-137]|uniref:NAD-P-binding protein n=1 Tax=Vararia minispora EC-137 TaxID=1314806 RepID=A0ACB8Q596_9AGAM|nr:NAD-P-binding protein [Vararia minispora EC-137]